MLELKNIKKDYPAGDGTVHALKGISLKFRDSDFVSILGPSGCGKTTMLNIIGGLDQYTEGDLIINGRSTKDFKDRDWDAYRNHSVGFVFQSYNLIPHQTVLRNVELALTVSGVSKSEREKRAKEALERVGLSTQLNKKPAELSGGQMQRVAIARAIVNNPTIILADEPTGALDTETSVQVMDILKEISKDRLVVMVTHNPDLAERYSTRIIRMLDGEITDDSAPLTQEEENREHLKEKSKTENKKLPSMSFFTSFGLSLKNLFTKKGRTALTSFAGSIGIIGIALIFAVSQGMTTYINTVEEDTLSSYPLTLEAQSMDMTSLMETFSSAAQPAGEHEKDAVYAKGMIYDMVNSLSEMGENKNDLASFKKYIEAELEKRDGDNALKEAVNGIQYTYDLDLLVYTKNVDGDIIRSDTEELMQDFLVEYLGTDTSSLMALRDQYGISESPMTTMMPGGMSSQLWQEMLPGENGKLVSRLLEKQYDVVYGSWPTEYNEIVLVLDENNELSDLSLYALGLSPKENVDKVMDAAINKTELPPTERKWSYEEICGMEYRTILNSDCYTLDKSTGTYKDLRSTDAGLQYLYDNAIPLKVSGIIRPKEDVVSAMLSGSIGYTSKLTEYVIEHSKESDAIKAQQAMPYTDIFTGLPFNENTGSMSDTEKETAFREYIKGMNESEKAAAYIQIMSIPSEEQLNASVSQTMSSMTRADMEAAMVQGLTEQMGMDEASVKDYVSSMSDEELTELFSQMAAEQVKMQYAAQVKEQMAGMEDSQLAAALDQAMSGYTTEQCALFYDEIT